jgi:pyridoxamine 5'-phosphate oxidase
MATISKGSAETPGLSREELLLSPFDQFNQWFEQVLGVGLPEPNTMTLATATPDGKPSVRVVLLKSVDNRGFVFFSNYQSRKGNELSANPRAALLFYWQLIERQVRIEGTVETLAIAESEKYFRSRPRESQISAWASQQSAVLSNRECLEEQADTMRKRFAGGTVPLPPFWGGYRVVPDRFEFWQSRPNRLHDRFAYTACSSGQWKIDRLSP